MLLCLAVFASGRTLNGEADRKLTADNGGHGGSAPDQEPVELESAEGLESIGGADTVEDDETLHGNPSR